MQMRRIAVTGAALSVLSGGLSLVTAPAAQAETKSTRISTSATTAYDASGTRWESVRGFVGGRAAARSTAGDITGTRDDVLYRTSRAGMSAFRRALPAGDYDVTLRAAEHFWSRPGQRVFSVTAEGRTVLRDVDLVKAVGKHAAYDRTFRVRVTDGVLDLGFLRVADVPQVSALKITPVRATATATAAQALPVRPGPTNTGVPPGTVLRPHYGNLTITTPGTTLDALDIHGFVTIKAPNVRITRSIVRGGKAAYSIGLVTNNTATATNFVIEESELVPEFPSVYLDGLKGSNITARRVNVHGTTDNVKIHGNNARIEDSWLHDSVYRASDPYQSGGPTHNDGVQVLGGKNIRILRNTITGARNAALQVTQDYSATTDLVFSDNHVDGGWCSVNLAHKKLTSMRGLTLTGNRFGRATERLDCAIIATRATSLTASGNVWDDTGLPVRIRDGG